MLGDKRSNSIFAAHPVAAPVEARPEPAEVHDIAFEEDTGRSIFAEAKVAPKASEVFFAPQAEGMPFGEVLSQVQSYLSGAYATLITDSGDEAKEQMKRRIARYLQDNRMAVDGMTQGELVDALYTEMAEYGFLTKYIFADGIEEIDINSWRDIEIQYSDGRTVKLEEHFDSPDHAANVIRRMLQNSGKVLDNASPIITSRLAKNIRVSVIKTPVLDEDAGVAASIRIVNPKNLTKEDFVGSGTATEEMLDFLSACLRYGVSICVAGATSSGKTTVAGWLMSTIPDRKRIFTIEDGSRELQLIREQNGRVVNSVVHTQTRDSENERQRILVVPVPYGDRLADFRYPGTAFGDACRYLPGNLARQGDQGLFPVDFQYACVLAGASSASCLCRVAEGASYRLKRAHRRGGVGGDVGRPDCARHSPGADSVHYRNF